MPAEFHWNTHSKFYEDHFWIWYLGLLEKYPINSPDSLHAYHANARKSIPVAVWNDKSIALQFKADPSMRLSNGSWANPRCPQFLERWDGIYAKFGFHPKRSARIVFSDTGKAGYEGYCQHSWPGVFECFVDRDAAMSADWFRDIEQQVYGEIDKPVEVRRPR